MSILAANFSEKGELRGESGEGRRERGELRGEKGLFTCPLVNLFTV